LKGIILPALIYPFILRVSSMQRHKANCILSCLSMVLLWVSTVGAADPQLASLIKDAIANNHEILMMEHRVKGARHRITQASALPDPMLMFGYQNEGWSRFTLGEMQGAQWALSISQSIPFPGKLALKEEVATREAEVAAISLQALKTRTAQRVYELYYDLFLVQRSLKLIKANYNVIQQMEDIALSRLSLGLIKQDEVSSLQTQRYMLIEQEAMLRQKAEALEGMLNAFANRDIRTTYTEIPDLGLTGFDLTLENVVRLSEENSYELKIKEQAQRVWESKVNLARREFYPDFTIGIGVFPRTGPFLDMWNLTVSMNIPIFYKSKQRQMVYEAEAMGNEARHELMASRAMLQASLREGIATIKGFKETIEVYKNALIPKAYQELEGMLYSYRVGSVGTTEVVQKIRQLIDLESAYWRQIVERQKAVIRIKALMGTLLTSEQH